MDIKRFVLPALTFFVLAGPIGSAAHAGPPTAVDPVAGSFQRLLDHPPTRSVPAVPGGTADPLRGAVSAVLWETRLPSFHLPADQARVPARPKPSI